MTAQIIKFSNLKYLSVTVFLLFAGCASSPSSNKPAEALLTRLKPADNFVHEASQMVFPKKVGNFESSQVTVYDESKTNISVKYLLESMGFSSALAEVYIYPAPASAVSGKMTLRQHYIDQRDLLVSIFPSAYDIEEGKIKIDQTRAPKEGLMLKFKRKPTKIFPRSKCFEKLYLFEHGPWFIKYRLTNPIGNEKKVKKKFDAFLQLLNWPELLE